MDGWRRRSQTHASFRTFDHPINCATNNQRARNLTQPPWVPRYNRRHVANLGAGGGAVPGTLCNTAIERLAARSWTGRSLLTSVAAH